MGFFSNLFSSNNVTTSYEVTTTPSNITTTWYPTTTPCVNTTPYLNTTQPSHITVNITNRTNSIFDICYSYNDTYAYNYVMGNSTSVILMKNGGQIKKVNNSHPGMFLVNGSYKSVVKNVNYAMNIEIVMDPSITTTPLVTTTQPQTTYPHTTSISAYGFRLQSGYDSNPIYDSSYSASYAAESYLSSHGYYGENHFMLYGPNNFYAYCSHIITTMYNTTTTWHPTTTAPHTTQPQTTWPWTTLGNTTTTWHPTTTLPHTCDTTWPWTTLFVTTTMPRTTVPHTIQHNHVDAKNRLNHLNSHVTTILAELRQVQTELASIQNSL